MSFLLCLALCVLLRCYVESCLSICVRAFLSLFSIVIISPAEESASPAFFCLFYTR